MASDATFDKVIAFTLDMEGGYANDPADPGGETNFGISKAAYGTLDIKTLTRDQAIGIYKRDYWPPWAAMPDPIAAKMFDLGVNMGVGGATRVLQRALIDLAHPMEVDGQLGPITRGAVAAVAPADLLPEIIKEAEAQYQAIAKAHPAEAKFLNGWLARARAIPVPVETATVEKPVEPNPAPVPVVAAPAPAPAGGINLAHVGAAGTAGTSLTAMLTVALAYHLHLPAEVAGADAGILVLTFGSLSGAGWVFLRKLLHA